MLITSIAIASPRSEAEERLFTVLDRINDSNGNANDSDTADALAERVAQLVRRALGGHAAATPIGRDDDLRTSGLSSLGLVNLMLSVEEEFGLKVPERDMTPANFRSIARIIDLICALSPQGVTNG
jgi:acyl carrier protein